MEIKTGMFIFNPHSGSGPMIQTQDITFDKPLTKAVAIITGNTFGFTPEDDHHLGRVTIALDTSLLGNIVRVTGTLGVRDWSGDWDDSYDGSINYAVIGE